MWRLGASLQADGKDKEALDAYVKSYPKDSSDSVKYSIIEALYQKINGSTEGLPDVINAQAKSASIIETQLKSTESSARAAETVSPKTEISTAQSADSKPIAENSPPARIINQPPQRIRFPREVPVKIETERTETEKTSKVTAAVKPSPNQDSEKPIIVEEKPVIVEEKPITIEPNPSKTENKTTTENPTELESKIPIENPAKPENKLTSENPVKTDTNAAPEVLPETEKPVIYKNHYPPSPKTAAESKNLILKTDDTKIADVQTIQTKPIFEPIIINVPKNEAEKAPVSETAKGKERTNSQTNSPDKNSEPLTTEKPKSVEASTDDAAPVRKPIDENVVSGFTRPRVIITENLPPATEISRTATIPPCTIVVGQENISLLGGGGSLGILVGFKEKGDLKELKAVSESPDDIEVIFDAEIGEIAGRSFFIVKSINTVKGSYKVTFEAPCGKKEILIKVR